jgi:hypothetical protein
MTDLLLPDENPQPGMNWTLPSGARFKMDFAVVAVSRCEELKPWRGFQAGRRLKSLVDH